MASTKLVQQARVRTNKIKESVCSVEVTPVTFEKLWGSYPSGHPYVDPKTGKPPSGYETSAQSR